ncbi:phosphotransferase enzyme family protein [Ophiocordyceps camponoti-floridani]|uniref:protein-ribulosamine 3-kinase n=1 Tax=Ophiocordyceps camponoti-floridani TaxID=2030778 RepID=A0A8H4Q1U1_9HYPO|nr:phosphotransferase enzyme family protein [Ophiocordyceps camponoti-floridani]
MIDGAIVEALGLDASRSDMVPHGNSAFSSTFKLATVTDGDRRMLFVKTAAGNEAGRMFAGEHASLNAIHDAVPNFCPKSHAHGALASDPNRFFLVTDFVDLCSEPSTTLSLAAKLARLHTTPAPVPDGHDTPVFGFPVSTFCGDTAQDNGWKTSWADFYADNRLRAVLRAGVAKHGPDAELADAVEDVAALVVPRLLGQGRLRDPVVPVVVHGDLWNGNHGTGRIGKGRAVENVVFDPSAAYAHSEYELGIMRMFGGFDSVFWDEYHKLVPKAEPVAEWEHRIMLYELYHHLNHFVIFGGGYRGGAMSIMKKLTARYGA